MRFISGIISLLPNRRACNRGEWGALTWDFMVGIQAQFGLNGMARMESRDFRSVAICWKRGKTSILRGSKVTREN